MPPLTSVPGQVSAGYIDGFLRDDIGSGTLGNPDMSLVPYTYAPLLEAPGADPQWVLDQFRQGQWGAFKGAPDGLGVLRPIGAPGSDNEAFQVSVIPQKTGVKQVPPTGSSARKPDYTWGPKDFALAIRHPGTTTWTAGGASAVRTYVAFMGDTNKIGMRLTTPAALGPWDAEQNDSADLALGNLGRPNMWDGQAHSVIVAVFGQNVLVILDFKSPMSFRAPRAYLHNQLGTPNPSIYSDMPTNGQYGGFDARGTNAYLYSWWSMQGPSGDFFLYNQGGLSVRTPSTTTYTLGPSGTAITQSGEAWNVTGTATASKDGVLLAASSTAYFDVAAPHGIIATKWGSTQSGAGLMVRRQDANNYYFVSSTGVYRYTAGVLSATLTTFTTPIANGDDVCVRNLPNQLIVYVNGVQRTNNVNLAQGQTGTGLGFLNPAGGTSQWSYIAHQPIFNPPVLPTS